MNLHAIDQGSGPPACLLHGLFGRAQNLAAVAKRLAASHRVISLDLRNHGASPHAAGMAYAEMAADVAETLEGLGAWPCALLGHSMGGKVAMMAALTWPDRVSRLVVGDIAPVAYAHHNAKVAAAMLALRLRPGLRRGEADAALAGAVSTPGVRAFLLQNLAFGDVPAWKIGLAEIAAGIPDIEGWPALAPGVRYEGPALFVAGGLSDYVSAVNLATIRQLFPAARHCVVEGAGHWLHADRPEAFGMLVATFFGEDG